MSSKEESSSSDSDRDYSRKSGKRRKRFRTKFSRRKPKKDSYDSDSDIKDYRKKVKKKKRNHYYVESSSSDEEFNQKAQVWEQGANNFLRCKCSLPAIRMKVENEEKENFGRYFFKCADGKCDFYVGDYEKNKSIAPPISKKEKKLIESGSVPVCYCKRPMVLSRVKKGVNAGRKFYKCPIWGCKKFIWRSTFKKKDNKENDEMDFSFRKTMKKKQKKRTTKRKKKAKKKKKNKAFKEEIESENYSSEEEERPKKKSKKKKLKKKKVFFPDETYSSEEERPKKKFKKKKPDETYSSEEMPKKLKKKKLKKEEIIRIEELVEEGKEVLERIKQKKAEKRSVMTFENEEEKKKVKEFLETLRTEKIASEKEKEENGNLIIKKITQEIKDGVGDTLKVESLKRSREDELKSFRTEKRRKLLIPYM